eukprot:5991256-Pyramimonas_sp.AAC.1
MQSLGSCAAFLGNSWSRALEKAWNRDFQAWAAFAAAAALVSAASVTLRHSASPFFNPRARACAGGAAQRPSGRGESGQGW